MQVGSKVPRFKRDSFGDPSKVGGLTRSAQALPGIVASKA